MPATASQALMTTDSLELVPSPKRIRIRFGGRTIADSYRAAMLYETGHLPIYYLPQADVRKDLLEPTDHHTDCGRKGQASYWTVRVGDRVAENAVWAYPNPIQGVEALADYVAFYWEKMDAWYEEDEEVDVHPRDPRHRVDTRPSSRHVRLELAGETVAETHRPTLLFETSLPTRYYIPATDARLDLLEPSETTTGCPYKGHARYYHVRIGDRLFRDLVWSYPYPRPEAFGVAGMLCFYAEKMDALYVDGDRVESSPRY
jgi:uncharacterized protein (DUF427 family)